MSNVNIMQDKLSRIMKLFKKFLRQFLGNMGFYDTKNRKREIRKTLRDKLLQMDFSEYKLLQKRIKLVKFAKILKPTFSQKHCDFLKN